jgi:ATP-dependent Clp protease ATP-binding subunit ClpC
MADYVLLLAVAVIAAFYLGWRMREARSPPSPRAERPAAIPEVLPSVSDTNALTTRLHELENSYAAFASNAAHPSALNANPQFEEAVRLLAQTSVPLKTVLQYAEGANWGLACAALAALKQRSDRDQATGPILQQCEKLTAWSMHFALDFLTTTDPRVPVGAPLIGAKEWWADNPFMPLFFRDYFARRAEQGDAATFGPALLGPGVSPHHVLRAFLSRVLHPFAQTLIQELDAQQPTAQPAGLLGSVGRFWKIDRATDLIIAPDAWRDELRLAEASLHQIPPRSLLLAGEPNVGKSSFLKLLAERIASDGWTVFEAGGADLMANQMYIGQLEGRIRSVVDELSTGRKLIWYIPDIVQLALSGRHQGQSASILEQILPAIAAGRLTVWCEASPAGAARLLQLQPSLRGLMEIVSLEALSSEDTLRLARQVIDLMGKIGVAFQPDCAEVALDTARQYLGTAGLPGSALLMLKLTAVRAEKSDEPIAPRQVLEMLSQLSGLPLAVLDTKERIDLQSIRAFFSARVIGQPEAVEAIVQRIAMLKAGLNDPDKPIAVFLFAGPTGTGKTELAKAVADFLFGSVERLIRLDMSEFQTPESLNKILGQPGAPAETDSLIARVRKQPFSVLLLDEFEKSHPMVWALFLQLFDDGRLTDAAGQTADFRHCLIILTSNLGATAHRSLGLGFAPQADAFTTEQIMKAIAQTYRPEFQNRLDKVIVFRPLTRDFMRGILKKELAGVLERRGLKDRDWAIEWESSALDFLLEKGFSPEMGARPLKRAIDQYVVAPLAALIVERRFPEGEQFVFVRSDGHAIQAEFVDPDAEHAASGAALGDRQSSAGPSLARMILVPSGSHAEFGTLEGELAGAERTLGSGEWEDLKTRLGAAMTVPGFWNDAERFVPLARLALMDRVKAAVETAQALRVRLARGVRGDHYSPELIGRLALQLHLVREGIKDAIEGAPVEVALTIEPVFERGDDRQAAAAWGRQLAAMYRAWADKRRMHLAEQPMGGSDMPVLVISGFGAHRQLARESGLHSWEASEGASARVTVRVVVAAVPLGDVPAGKSRAIIAKVIAETPRESTVVRRYRELPPLVRSGDGRWRSGRLDLVLAGAFDLMQADEK